MIHFFARSFFVFAFVLTAYANNRGTCSQASNYLLNPMIYKSASVRTVYDWREFFPAVISKIQTAKTSVKMSTFFLGDDEYATRVMGAIQKAADKGIKVQMLLDSGYGMGDPRKLKTLSDHPNIEIKIYNPMPSIKDIFKNPVAWIKEMIILNRTMDMPFWNLMRANYRLHDKIWLIDGVSAFIGSSNIKGHSPTLGPVEDRIERDFLIEGELTTDIDAYYKELWNSRLVVDSTLIRAISKLEPEETVTAAEEINFYARDIEIRPVEYQFRSEAHPSGRAFLLVDNPLTLKKKTRFGVAPEVLTLIRNAKKEVVISAPYFIMTQEFEHAIKVAIANEVKVKIITNSHKSMDYAAPQIVYERDKRKIRKMGVELFEYMGTHKLHPKTIIIDNKKVIIGTYNIDPRTQNLNREVVAVIQSRSFIEETMADFNQILENTVAITADNDRPQRVIQNNTLGEKFKAYFLRSLL